MKILYCVLHTRSHTERMNNILETWGRDVDRIFYSDHEDSENNVIRVCDRSDYISCQIKAIKILHLLNAKMNNYDWYFFCDNDTFVNTNKLYEYAQDADINSIHGQIINCWPSDPTLSYPSGGAGYLMSNSVLKFLSDASYNDTIYGDVSIGLNIRRKNIPMVDPSLFHSQKKEYYGINEDQVKDNITFHYINSLNEMKRLYELSGVCK